MNTFPTKHRLIATLSILLSATGCLQAQKATTKPAESAILCAPSEQASPFIPLDSWIYPAMDRLHALGFVDTAYIGLRPWSRKDVAEMLDESSDLLQANTDDASAKSNEALDTFNALLRELRYSKNESCLVKGSNFYAESAYSVSRVITGTPLHDSYHLGSTIVNDYGRPVENGINNYSGASGYATLGRFVFYARGEFQGSESAAGYSAALAQKLSVIDGIIYLNPTTKLPYSQPTIPQGPISAIDQGRVLEAYVATRFLGHTISFGKQDEWMGPAKGASMAYSNNAENIYALHINRNTPLMIPGLSKLTGPFRYEMVVGPLKGHNYIPPASLGGNNYTTVLPGSPWVHIQKVSFKPTRDLEVGFSRSAIWGGKGHEPITIGTFWHSFISTKSPTDGTKFTNKDPGARFASFDFSWRLPMLRDWVTLYTDSNVHDDISAVDAPRRGAWHPGIYFSHLPGAPKLDLRFEGTYTDLPIRCSQNGQFLYYEGIVRQGYTNNGQIFGDWVGRQGKSVQGWATWHLTPSEQIQASFRTHKVANGFIPGGTTLNDVNVNVIKNLRKDLTINGTFTYEHWLAPIYMAHTQTVSATTIQLLWTPQDTLRRLHR